MHNICTRVGIAFNRERARPETSNGGTIAEYGGFGSRLRDTCAAQPGVMSYWTKVRGNGGTRRVPPPENLVKKNGQAGGALGPPGPLRSSVFLSSSVLPLSSDRPALPHILLSRRRARGPVRLRADRT